MLHDSPAFCGFSVDSLPMAKRFYGQTLGLEIQEDEMGLRIRTGSGFEVFIYAKTDHIPASYTVLNFPVDNIDAVVDGLTELGVTFEKYPELTDARGIARGRQTNRGPDIAWFKDPAGNFLSVLSD